MACFLARPDEVAIAKLQKESSKRMDLKVPDEAALAKLQKESSKRRLSSCSLGSRLVIHFVFLNDVF